MVTERHEWISVDHCHNWASHLFTYNLSRETDLNVNPVEVESVSSKVFISNERVDWWYWRYGTQNFASHRILWVLIIRFDLNSCTISHGALIYCGGLNHGQTQFEVPNLWADFLNRLWWRFSSTDYWFCDSIQSYLLTVLFHSVTYYIVKELNSQIIITSFSIKPNNTTSTSNYLVAWGFGVLGFWGFGDFLKDFGGWVWRI